MKELQFQHYRKAPHPFQQYGYFPPTALKNRSMPVDYASLPQGEDAFLQKIGKKLFDQKYKSSFGNNRLGDYKDESLNNQLDKYNHRVGGKSLQTNDIEGAQGGSLKSPAVKYKQKAQKLKIKGAINGYDRHQYQQQQYKCSIQHAIKNQHSNDMQIRKLISNKGHGHYLNPQKSQKITRQNNRAGFSSNKLQQQIFSLKQNKYQPYLKMKHQSFDSKDKNYQQFFTQLNKKEQNYNQFFSKLRNNSKNQYSAQSYTQILDMPSSPRKQQSSQILKKYRTVQLEKEFKNSYEPYSQRNFSKRSIESQFKRQQGGGSNILQHLNKDISENRGQNTPLSSSRKSDIQQLSSKGAGGQQKILSQISRMVRRLNPTNLSTGLNAVNFKSDN